MVSKGIKFPKIQGLRRLDIKMNGSSVYVSINVKNEHGQNIYYEDHAQN